MATVRVVVPNWTWPGCRIEGCGLEGGPLATISYNIV